MTCNEHYLHAVVINEGLKLLKQKGARKEARKEISNV